MSKYKPSKIRKRPKMILGIHFFLLLSSRLYFLNIIGWNKFSKAMSAIYQGIRKGRDNRLNKNLKKSFKTESYCFVCSFVHCFAALNGSWNLKNIFLLSSNFFAKNYCVVTSNLFLNFQTKEIYTSTSIQKLICKAGIILLKSKYCLHEKVFSKLKINSSLEINFSNGFFSTDSNPSEKPFYFLLIRWFISDHYFWSILEQHYLTL